MINCLKSYTNTFSQHPYPRMDVKLAAQILSFNVKVSSRHALPNVVQTSKLCSLMDNDYSRTSLVPFSLDMTPDFHNYKSCNYNILKTGLIQSSIEREIALKEAR